MIPPSDDNEHAVGRLRLVMHFDKQAESAGVYVTDARDIEHHLVFLVFFQRLPYLSDGRRLFIIDVPGARDKGDIGIVARLDPGFAIERDVVRALPALFRLVKVLLMVGALDHPAGKVLHVFAMLAEMVPHIACFPLFFAAPRDFVALHGSLPLKIE